MVAKNPRRMNFLYWSIGLFSNLSAVHKMEREISYHTPKDYQYNQYNSDD